ncbi:MAG: hypothetical protein ACRDTA_22520 [Pseudonocardiaceae bacterium]
MAAAVTVLALAVGCADGGDRSAGPAQVEASAGQSTPVQSPKGPPLQETVVPSDKRISASISNGKVEGVPARVEVDRGTPVRIEVTSDRSDELHVHGYDKTVPLAPGSPAVAQFVADLPGVFEVETHDSGLLLFQLVVRG